jgi:hypothetical protein
MPVGKKGENPARSLASEFGQCAVEFFKLVLDIVHFGLLGAELAIERAPLRPGVPSSVKDA